jgi:hypothetical protein
MSTNLFRLVYCSRNTISGQQGDPAVEMAGILAVSRGNNARDGVTGALLYSEGCFAQVLEGGLEAVERTFERIQCDPRHSDVVVLRAARAEGRLFGVWDMALAEIADPAKASAILGRALAQVNGNAGADVVALLSGLVHREAEWAC